MAEIDCWACGYPASENHGPSGCPAQGVEQVCEWFALCDRPAVFVLPHPAFGKGVPTCKRCAERVARG